MYLHFKCYPLCWFPLQNPFILLHLLLLLWRCSLQFSSYLPTPTLLPWPSHILENQAFTGPRPCPPIDASQCHPLLHMQLEPWVPPCILFGWWFNPLKLWGYWLIHIVVSYGSTNPFNSLSPFSSSSIGNLVLSPMVGWEHPPLYYLGTGRASQETAISATYQQALVGIHKSVWVWWLDMSWIPR